MATRTQERRVFALERCEIRRAPDADGGKITFSGYAAVFNELSVDLGGFRERILPECFDATLAADADIRFLINHDSNLILGRTKAGTVSVTKDEIGLKVEGELPDTSYARDLIVSMERGDITQMSFGFFPTKDSWDSDRDAETGLPIRNLHAAELFDVSAVTFPAYPETSAEVRAIAQQLAGDDKRVTVNLQVDVEELVKKALAEKLKGSIVTPAADLEQVAEADGITKTGIEAKPNGSIVTLRGDEAEERSLERERRAYSRISQVIAETPWAMLPEMLTLFLTIVGERASGTAVSDEEISRRIALHEVEEREAAPAQTGPVAVIPIHGPIYPRAGLIKNASEEAVSLEDFQASFRQAMADPNVKAVVLNIDSPGGTVDMVPEVADEIRAARDTKQIVAVANTMAASAAYWLASAAGELVVTPSGEVGSIGVYAAHQDISAALEMEGVHVTLISAGKYKVDGNPFEPLSESARQEIQDGVDEYYGMFVGAVAKGRGVSPRVVRSEQFGQGRMLSAKKALDAGMVDRIETLDQTIARLSRSTRSLDNVPETIFETRAELRNALGLSTRNNAALDVEIVVDEPFAGAIELELLADELRLRELEA